MLTALIVTCTHLSPAAIAQGKRVGNSSKKADRERGRELVRAYQCGSCHVIDGKGPKEGVSLDRLNRSKKFIVEQLLDPEEHVATNAAAFNFDPNLMPSHELDRSEALAIADYLLSKDQRAAAKKMRSLSGAKRSHKLPPANIRKK